MTANRKRGRPKGTGLDDTPSLSRIADIIVANPAIKRTTAIKKIGVTNPSIVRRLRDKFAESETALLADARRRLSAQQASTTAKVNGTSPQGPRLDGLAFVAATAAQARGKVGKPAAAHALANTAGQSKKTGPVSAASSSAPTGKTERTGPLPGIAALFTNGDVTPLQVAEDIVTIRNAVLASKQPLELVLTMLKDVNIENLVSRGLTTLLGTQGQKSDAASIISLIASQAKMMDVILPLLAQFATGAATGQQTATPAKKAAAA